MSANRERNFGRPSLGNPFSGRERYWYRIRDRETGKILDEDFDMNRTGSVEISGDAVVTRPAWVNKPSKAFSLKNVVVEGDRIRTV